MALFINELKRKIVLENISNVNICLSYVSMAGVLLFIVYRF